MKLRVTLSIIVINLCVITNSAFAKPSTITVDTGSELLAVQTNTVELFRIQQFAKLYYRPRRMPVRPYVGIGGSYFRIDNERALPNSIKTNTLYDMQILPTYILGIEMSDPPRHGKEPPYVIFAEFEGDVPAGVHIRRARARIMGEDINNTSLLNNHADSSIDWRQWTVGAKGSFAMEPTLFDANLDMIWEISLSPLDVTISSEFDNEGLALQESYGQNLYQGRGGHIIWLTTLGLGIRMHGYLPVSGYVQMFISPIPDAWAIGLNSALTWGHVH